jgi:hypothetical protein
MWQYRWDLGADNPQRRNQDKRLARTETGIAKLEMINEIVYKLY